MNLNVGGSSYISSSSSSDSEFSDDELQFAFQEIEAEEAVILRMLSNNLLIAHYLNQQNEAMARKGKMTQKRILLKGQQKKKSIPPNRHGKTSHTRKGKRVVKPSKVTKEMGADKDLSKFISDCNEVEAATVANKDGCQLGIVKPQPDSTSGAKK
ncbi:hypothetical protein Pfo_001731 [Paulownia fortunei]|nr:hypothetical protein Pfo_001731 [Paulownia fortunei]